jgi:hypothetical protein
MAAPQEFGRKFSFVISSSVGDETAVMIGAISQGRGIKIEGEAGHLCNEQQV